MEEGTKRASRCNIEEKSKEEHGTKVKRESVSMFRMFRADN